MARFSVITLSLLITAAAVSGALGVDAALAQEEIASPSTNECEGAEAWLEGSWERQQEAAQVMQRFGAELADGPPFDVDLLDGLADDMREIARLHEDSDPPSAAKEVNRSIVLHRALYAEGMEKAAESARSNDESLGEEAADLIHRASELGKKLPTVIQQFKSAYGLADNPAFDLPSCYGEETTRWLAFTQIRWDEFVGLVESARSDFDAGRQINDAIDAMKALRDEQEQSKPAKEAQVYHSVVIHAFDTAIAMHRAAVAGDQAEVDRLYDGLGMLDSQKIEEEEKLIAACANAGG